MAPKITINTKMPKTICGWTYEKDEKLINLVKSRPELYDIKARRYNDNIAKKNAWLKIGNLMNTPGANCKVRWESLRSQYRKNLYKRNMKNGTGHLDISKWRLEEQMSFLQEHMKDKLRDGTSISGDEDVIKDEFHEIVIEESEQEGEVTQNGGLRGKCAYTDDSRIENFSTDTLVKYLVEKRENETKHPIDIFFSLMATSVKRFKVADQHLVKTKVFAIVNEIEGRYIEEDPSVFDYQLACKTEIASSSSSPALSHYRSTSSSSETQQEGKIGENQF